MIKYAGVELTLPTPELTALLDLHYATTDLTPFPVKSALDTPPGCPATLLGTPVPVRVNTLTWPTAPQRWAQGYFLASDEQLACIRNEIGGQIYAPFEMWDTVGANTTTTSTTTTTPASIELFRGPSRIEAQLAIAGVHPLFDVTGGQKLHLLSFVDRRYFWWYTSAPTTTPGSWSELWTNALIAGGVGSQYRIIDPIPEALGVPSGRWRANRWKGYQLPVYLDCAAQLTQARVVCRMDETVRIERPTHRNEDQNQLESFSLYRRLGGESPLKELAKNQPEKVTVVFFSANDEPCEGVPEVQEILLADLVADGTEIPLDDLCGYDPATTTTTTPAGTTTTTTQSCVCTYQFQYDADGNLVLPPTPYESNNNQAGGCNPAPSPSQYPPATGTPNSITVVSQACDPFVSTTTTCAGTTSTTQVSPGELPMLPSYGTETGVPETSVYLWADGTTPDYLLARRLAVDWYEWRLSQVEALFNSCIGWTPTGFTDSLVYRHDTQRFDTRIFRVPGGPDNVVAVGLECDIDPPGETPTTSTTPACTGTAILVNSYGEWTVESSTCSCDCQPSYPADCPDDTSTCERRVVPCVHDPAPPPVCVTTSTTTTPYVGPPTTTTTPFCPPAPPGSPCATTTTTPACQPCAACAGQVNGCAWWTGVFGVQADEYTTCWIGGSCCPTNSCTADGCVTEWEVTNCDGMPVVISQPCCPGCSPVPGPLPPCTVVYSDCPPYTPPPPPPAVPCYCTGGCIYYADTYLDEWIPDEANVCACRTNIQGVGCSSCTCNCDCVFCDQTCPPRTGPCSCDFPSDPPSAMGVTDCGAAIGFPCKDRTVFPPGYDPNTDPCNPNGGTTTTPYQPDDLCDVRGCTWYSATAGSAWVLQESFCELECACLAPAFESTVDCQTVNSSCLRLSDVTTTTTGCTGGCFYSIGPSGTVLLSNTCSTGCSCPTTPVNPVSIGADTLPGFDLVQGDCESDTPPTTTTTTTNGCTGDCTYTVTYDNDGNVISTVLTSNTCSVGCDCPNTPENNGIPIGLRPLPGTQVVIGTCMVGSPPVTTTTTTTTTTPGCSGTCWVTVEGGVITSINGDCATAVDCGCLVNGTTYELGDPSTIPCTDEGPCIGFGVCDPIP